MKILIIGGTGTISMSVTQLLAKKGNELFLINRGTRQEDIPSGVTLLKADINDERTVLSLLGNLRFDAVIQFCGFVPFQLERDYRLFKNRTRQYIFISSAAVYSKPVSSPYITEGTTLCNPYWSYAQDKIACEEYLMKLYRESGFPITIVRPSHTYDNRAIPLGVHGSAGSWQVAKRMLDGKRVIIHGDGTSLWTMTCARDFAKGLAGLVGNVAALGEAFHITSNESLTWNQIYKAIAAALDVELKAVHVSSEFLNCCTEHDLKGTLIGDKANSMIFDNTKIKRYVPDFVAATPFAVGIRETVSYIKKHPQYMVEDPAFDAWCDKVLFAIDTTKKLLD